MVGHAASHTGIVHANMTLTPSNVKVTELLKLSVSVCCTLCVFNK